MGWQGWLRHVPNAHHADLLRHILGPSGWWWAEEGQQRVWVGRTALHLRDVATRKERSSGRNALEMTAGGQITWLEPRASVRPGCVRACLFA